MGNMPSTQLSVLYNANGKASAPALTAGANTWSIMVKDAYGNQATSLNATY